MLDIATYAHAPAHTKRTDHRALRAVSLPASRAWYLLAWCMLSAFLLAAFGASDAQARKVYSPAHGGHVRASVISRLGPVLSTWYGPGFWGHRTGCGRPLKRATWGIAHRTLPCGRLVLLRYHGREVAVPVIDRGPYSGASIDLTQRTADYLNFTKAGAGDIRMTVLDRRVPRRRL